MVIRVGVEGTGAYGAGLARYLAKAGVEVVEVDRPNRQTRRRKGKSDPVDAEAAARAALSGEASGRPKSRTGTVEMIRALRVARRSACKARTQASNQLHDLVLTAPDELRAILRTLTLAELVQRAARWRPGTIVSPTAATKLSLSLIARRHQALSDEMRRLDAELARLVEEVAHHSSNAEGLGTDTTGAFLVAVGDNPGRLRSEASFAALCGASPIDASSGKQQRHRLNRGGDRQANQALWRVVMVRMTCDPRTREYIARRRTEGRPPKKRSAASSATWPGRSTANSSPRWTNPGCSSPKQGLDDRSFSLSDRHTLSLWSGARPNMEVCSRWDWGTVGRWAHWSLRRSDIWHVQMNRLEDRLSGRIDGLETAPNRRTSTSSPSVTSVTWSVTRTKGAQTLRR